MATQPREWHTNSIETVELPPSEAAQGNPFEDNDTSPFEDIAPTEAPPETLATPVRTQIAAMATLDPAQASTQSSVLRNLEAAVAESSALLDAQEERMLRYQSASRQIIERSKGIKKLEGDPMVSPELLTSINAALQNNINTDIEVAQRTALEEEAFDKIRDLLSSGQTTEARIMLRQYEEGKGSTVDVIKNNVVKRMLLAGEIEKAQGEVKDESWLHWAISGLISIPSTILMGESFTALGNVKDGTNGYKSAWHRLFTPGSDMAKQIEAVQGMSASEFAEYLPTLKANIQENSELFLSDPGIKQMLLQSFDEGITEEQIRDRNIFAMVDAAGVLPIGWAKKALTVPFNLQMAGARKAAQGSVARAFNTIVKEGEESSLTKTGIGIEQVEDNILPTAINPHKVEAGGRPLNGPAVSLSADVNDGIEAASKALDELQLSETNRFINQGELDEAVEATVNRMTERVGTVLKDHEVVPVALPDGTRTFKVVGTIGDKKGGGFATYEEAVGFLQSRGFTSENMIVDDVIETTTRRTTPRDEGYNYLVYHGTDADFEQFKPSSAGKLGPGVYAARDVEIANDYTNIMSKEGGNIRPQLVNEDKIFGLKNLEGWAYKDMVAAVKELKIPKKTAVPFLDDAKRLLDQRATAGYSELLDSQTFIKALQRFYKDEEIDGMLSIGAKLNEQLAAKGYHGIAGNMWGDVEINIFDPKNIRSALEANIIKDVSQQYFGKIEMNIPETGFYSTPTAPPAQNFLSKFWKTTSQTMDRRLFEQAARAGQKRNRLYKIIEQNMVKAFRGLDRKERFWLEQILAEGDKRSMWFSDESFNVLFERSTGAWPTEKVLNAYKQYRFNNDREFVLRQSDMYRQKAVRGFESAKFSTFGDQHDVDIILDWTPASIPTKARVYNLSDDIHYTSSDIHGSVGKLTPEKLRELRERGYVMFRTEQAIDMKDGTTVDWFLAKRDDVQVRPLRQNQLAYKAGGHRLYADKYFVKQASWGIQGDTKKKFLRNPNVWVTAPTVKNAREWAEKMNIARLAVKDGKDAGYLDQNIFRQDKGFPTGDEFLENVEKGRIDLDEEFEAVFDREMPKAYTRTEDVERFVDEEEVGFNGYYRTTGKMYYSPKGEALKDYTGDYAPTIDPFEAQSRALNNVAQMSSFSDFKTSAIDRWVRSYRPYLNTRDLPAEQAASPMHTFVNAQIHRDVPISLRQQIEGQRESIQRILGFESDWDRGYRNFMRSTAEWVVGDSDNALRQWASKGVLWWQDKNPLGVLRGFAFDMKLGMGNIGQFFIQTSTMASALALSPRLGAKGVASVPGIRLYLISGANENVLDTVVKRGMHKLAGFDDVEEYKWYVREAARSGFLDVGDTHIMVNNVGPANTFGSLKGGVEAAREMGRFFFYEAEVWNRLTALRIAYGEAVERFGKEARDGFEFKDFMAGRAENYSFNMSNESKAAWQTGLLSVPTQFWAYNVRMIEALVGSNFTRAQKLRLALMQLGIAGTGGLPVVAGISEWIKQQHGTAPDINTMLGTLDRGVADRLIYEMFGADIKASEKWGTGSWSSDLVKDIFGMSEYNEKSFAEMTFGATGSILGTALGSVVEVAKLWMTHESGSEEIDLVEDQVITLLRQISSINNGLKAHMVHQYGVLQSTKGSMLVHGLPPQDAAFIALGFNPGEMDEIAYMMAASKDRKADIDDASKEINNLWAEAVAIPTKFEENAKKVNLLVQLLPPEIKKDVLKKVHKNRDPSLYGSLLTRKAKLEVQDEQAKGAAQ